jgi:hypothetical protein
MAEELPNRSAQLPIDRRRLLKTSVAITAATLAPILGPSETAPVVVVSTQTASTASEAILNVCATTARRIAEIRRRNETRREAKLDLLPIVKELRRMKETEDSQKFSDDFGRFAAKYSKSVWDEVLKPRREAPWRSELETKVLERRCRVSGRSFQNLAGAVSGGQEGHWVGSLDTAIRLPVNSRGSLMARLVNFLNCP